MRGLKRKGLIRPRLYNLHLKVLKSKSFKSVFKLGARRNAWKNAETAYNRLFPVKS